jgi:hypothetical protein
MREELNSSDIGHRSPFTRPTPVALTLLATGAVLAPAVNATFPILAVLVCGVLALGGLTAVLAVCKRTRAVYPRAKKSESPMPPIAVVDGSLSFIVLPAHARADEMTRVLLAHQNYFPVAQGREVVGAISKCRLLTAIALGQGDRLIAELMNHTGRLQPVLAYDPVFPNRGPQSPKVSWTVPSRAIT